MTRIRHIVRRIVTTTCDNLSQTYLFTSKPLKVNQRSIRKKSAAPSSSHSFAYLPYMLIKLRHFSIFAKERYEVGNTWIQRKFIHNLCKCKSCCNKCCASEKCILIATLWARATNFVKKPSLIFNVTFLELNDFNASMWVPSSPSDLKKSQCIDQCISNSGYV